MKYPTFFYAGGWLHAVARQTATCHDGGRRPRVVPPLSLFFEEWQRVSRCDAFTDKRDTLTDQWS
jgi:hypothetical protein